LILIEHFDKYPLITKKAKDFVCFKQAIFLVKNKEHLTKQGLLKLVSLKALMGKGLTNELKAAFPDILPANELGISDLTLSLPPGVRFNNRSLLISRVYISGRLFYHRYIWIYICKNRIPSTVKICTNSTLKR